MRTLPITLVCAVAFTVVAGTSVEVPTVRKDHPRLFFNAETWPAISNRAVTVKSAELRRLLTACDRMTDTPRCRGTEMPPPKTRIENGKTVVVPHNANTGIPPIVEFGHEAAMCALAWRFTGEAKYLAKAKRMIAESARGYNEAYANGRAVNWYIFSRMNCFCAYDWIAEALDAEERRQLLTPLLKHVGEALDWKRKILRRDNSGPKEGNYGIPALPWYAGVAAYGDGVDDAAAQRFLTLGWKNARDLFTVRSETAGDDGAFRGGTVGYSMGCYPLAQFNLVHTLRSACGVDLAAEYPQLALFPNWVWWTWIPDAAHPDQPRHAGYGDDNHESLRLPLGGVYEHMVQYSSLYRDIDPASARLAASLAQMMPARLRRISDHSPVYPFLLDEADCAEPLSREFLENAPLKARHFENAGQFLMRSAWKGGETFASFSAGGLPAGHRHRDENSFTIFRHDALALDSGTRAYQTDFNLRHYYAQTVAHNAILIHKDGEPLGSHWGVKCPDKQFDFNHGGQFKDGVATVKAFETTADYTYVASDAAAVYGDKCRRALRQFVHVQPDCFVVYDRVENDGEYRTEYLLHVENEPRLDGRTLVADSREGRLCQQTLLPADAELARVGGPGKEWWANGRNWEVDEKYLRQAERLSEKSGVGPYFGKWRLEVRPAKAVKNPVFLHVLNATDSREGKPVVAAYVREGNREGAVLTKPDGTKIKVLFNREGEPGGEIVVQGRKSEFANVVQKQSGTIFGTRPTKFPPYQVKTLEPRPDFWQVRANEIVELCEGAKKCSRKEIIAYTPLGYPVYALFYGDFSDDDGAPQTNWSAGSASTNYRNYYGRKRSGRQTFLLLTGVHGAEPESVAGAVNLIRMLETGTDFRGKADPELLDLIAKYRFIVVPCLNMDGRAISPDHLRGVDWNTFRHASQGIWKDGSRIGWRGSKSWFPLPLDRVAYPGGYPNADGYNLMHDAAPGDIKAEETRGLLRLIKRWRVDAVLNGHSYEYAHSIVRPSSFAAPENLLREQAIRYRVNKALHEKGLMFHEPKAPESDGSCQPGINLNTMMALASGALTLTLECSVSYDVPDKEGAKAKPSHTYTFEELMAPIAVALREYLRDGLEKPFLARGGDVEYKD